MRYYMSCFGGPFFLFCINLCFFGLFGCGRQVIQDGDGWFLVPDSSFMLVCGVVACYIRSKNGSLSLFSQEGGVGGVHFV